MKFAFVARCGEQTMPLEVSTDYRPGRQVQRARRLAVGELLALLEAEKATVDASGDEMVSVATEAGVWVIAEGGKVSEGRGRI